MALEGREEPKQLLTVATADVGVGENGSRAPNLAPLEVERSSWSVWKRWGRSGLGKVLPGEAAGSRLGPGHGAPGRWRGGVGVCGVKKDLNTEGPGSSPSRGKCAFPRIRWQPLAPA